jgi:hypothetical protein
MKSPSKYGNRKTIVDGLTFASAKEARRFGELKLLQRAGQIANLKLQPKFPLAVNGKVVCTYIADFQYDEFDGLVVEDVKSEATRKNRAYRIKNKLFAALFGFPIREV